MGRRKKKPYLVEGVDIVDTATKGWGIGKKDGQVIFVEHTVPGDKVDVWVNSKVKKVPKGRVQAIYPDNKTLRQSPRIKYCTKEEW